MPIYNPHVYSHIHIYLHIYIYHVAVGYPDEWPESVFRNEGQLVEENYAANVDMIGRNAVKRSRIRVFETPARNR